MAELTVNQLIKIAIGVAVVVAVVTGLSLFFKEKVFGFFEGLPTGEPVQFVRGLFR